MCDLYDDHLTRIDDDNGKGNAVEEKESKDPIDSSTIMILF